MKDTEATSMPQYQLLEEQSQKVVKVNLKEPNPKPKVPLTKTGMPVI